MALGKTLAYLAKMTASQQKFAEGVASGLPAVRAYMIAYPKAKESGAHASASKSLKNPKIASEIDRIRKRTQEVGGGAVLTLLEKRLFLAAVVRCKIAEVPNDSPLWQSIKHSKDGVEYKLPDKLRAIQQDNDLAGEGAESQKSQALLDLLERI